MSDNTHRPRNARPRNTQAGDDGSRIKAVAAGLTPDEAAALLGLEPTGEHGDAARPATLPAELGQLLDAIYVVLTRPPDADDHRAGRATLAALRKQLSPAGRVLLDAHFDAQQMAAVAAAPHTSPWRRLAALRLLACGATEWHTLVHDGRAVTTPSAGYLLVQWQAQRGWAHEASESLHMITGMSPQACRQIVDRAFDETSERHG